MDRTASKHWLPQGRRELWLSTAPRRPVWAHFTDGKQQLQPSLSTWELMWSYLSFLQPEGIARRRKEGHSVSVQKKMYSWHVPWCIPSTGLGWNSPPVLKEVQLQWNPGCFLPSQCNEHRLLCVSCLALGSLLCDGRCSSEIATEGHLPWPAQRVWNQKYLW